MQDRKPQDQDKFVVRLPDGMRDRIKAAADANSRSMNAEIVSVLEDRFPPDDDIDKVDLALFTIRELLLSGQLDADEISEALDKAEDGLEDLQRRLARSRR